MAEVSRPPRKGQQVPLSVKGTLRKGAHMALCFAMAFGEGSLWKIMCIYYTSLKRGGNILVSTKNFY